MTQPQQQAPLQAEYRQFNPEYSVDYLLKVMQRAGVPTFALNRDMVRKVVVDIMAREDRVFLNEQNAVAIGISKRKFVDEQKQDYRVAVGVKAPPPAAGQSL